MRRRQLVEQNVLNGRNMISAFFRKMFSLMFAYVLLEYYLILMMILLEL